jgi:hypothetical protein
VRECICNKVTSGRLHQASAVAFVVERAGRRKLLDPVQLAMERVQGPFGAHNRFRSHVTVAQRLLHAGAFRIRAWQEANENYNRNECRSKFDVEFFFCLKS